MHAFTSIFSLLVAAAGWYYMFYSRMAEKLAPIEEQQINRRRSRLRRIGGFFMFLLAVFLFAGFHTRQISIFEIPADSVAQKPDFWRVSVLGLVAGVAASWVFSRARA